MHPETKQTFSRITRGDTPECLRYCAHIQATGTVTAESAAAGLCERRNSFALRWVRRRLRLAMRKKLSAMAAETPMATPSTPQNWPIKDPSRTATAKMA